MLISSIKIISIKLLLTALSTCLVLSGQCEKDMNTQNSNHMSNDLLIAAKNGDVGEVKRLVSTGADIEIRDANRRTPLMLATLANHVEVAKILIEKGANVNAQDHIKDSPFLYAGANGYLEIGKLCLTHGADFKVYNRYGGSALIPASEKGHVETVAELLKVKGFPINHVNNLGWTAVLETVILTNGGPKFIQILKMLVDAGCDVNIPDSDGVTALTHAKRQKYQAMIKILETAGAKE